MWWIVVFLTGVFVLSVDVAVARELRIFAAGSLRLPLEEILAVYEQQTGTCFVPIFGPSGKLRQMIEQGDIPEVFASAAITHTEALAASGKLRDSKVFTRNSLCLMAAPGRQLEESKLVDIMLDPNVRLGTSTPKSDPSGDYTWELFRRLDTVCPHAYAQLNAKALQLTGKEVSREEKELPYARVFQDNQADVFVSYCTNAVAMAAKVPGLTWARFPATLNVAATYGIGIARQAGPEAEALVAFIQGPERQRILEKYGFK